MEVFGSLLGGFATALTPQNLLYAGIGVFLGTAIGVLPGIGPALTISLLLPITFGLDAVPAFIMFGGIYYGAMYGGSTTSILVNTPGESASVVTAIDGYQMAKKGRGGAALATSAIGSFVAGTIATFLLMFLAVALVSFAVKLGPPEYFAIMLLALAAVTSLSGTSAPKSFFATLLGLALGLVGTDNQTGQLRLTFGISELESGIDVVLGAIGLFAVGEVLWYAATLRSQQAEERLTLKGSIRMNGEEFRRSWPAWLRGSAVGFFIGLWVRLLDIPEPLLYGGILVVSAVGVYSLNRSATDLIVVFVLGVVGYLMRRFDYPLAPVILGIVLAPLIDNNFRRAMIMTDGDLIRLVTRPATATTLVIALAFLMLPFMLRLYARRTGNREVAELAETDVG